MSTPSYLIAHRALPLQAGTRPVELWRELSGPEWSTWLAMVAHELQVKVRHIGVEGAPLGKAVIRRDGYELLAMYFPAPEASGEPYYAILGRRAGDTRLRSFVFERGTSGPGEPLRVVMAEWTARSADDIQRMRFDATPDASLEACIARTVAEMKSGPGPSLAGPSLAGSAPTRRGPAASSAHRPAGGSVRNIAVILIAVLIALLAIFVAMRA